MFSKQKYVEMAYGTSDLRERLRQEGVWAQFLRELSRVPRRKCEKIEDEAERVLILCIWYLGYIGDNTPVVEEVAHFYLGVMVLDKFLERLLHEEL